MKTKPASLPEDQNEQGPAPVIVELLAEPEKPKIAVRFLGSDIHFWQGIPARDLTADDWDKVSEDDKEQVLALNLYELLSDNPEKDGE